jgi:RNA recognition motif-containing protein
MLLRGTFLDGEIMENKLYVGNLPYTYSDNDMERTFAEFGSVSSAKIVMDRESGRSKGFGFVEMGSAAEATAAINGLHGRDMGGRDMVVNVAKPMEPRAPRAGGNRY